MTGSTSSDMLATAGAAAPHQSAAAAAAVASPAIAGSSAARGLTDPIFAALDAWRSAKAERTAAQQVAGDDCQTAEEWRSPEWQRYEHAIDREFEAKYAVCEVVPTTAAGAAALVRFLAAELMFDEVDYGSNAAEESAKEALANLDRMLSEISARCEKAGDP